MRLRIMRRGEPQIAWPALESVTPGLKAPAAVLVLSTTSWIFGISTTSGSFGSSTTSVGDARPCSFSCVNSGM